MDRTPVVFLVPASMPSQRLSQKSDGPNDSPLTTDAALIDHTGCQEAVWMLFPIG